MKSTAAILGWASSPTPKLQLPPRATLVASRVSRTARLAMRDGRRAITMIEVLCVVGIIGILVALLLPAIMFARESSRRTACQNNLRQIGLAVLQYENTHRALPPGRDAEFGRDHSWVTRVLPQLELSRLFERYDFNQHWNDDTASQNRSIAATNLKLFLCPSTLQHESGASDYGGNYGSSLSGLPKGFGLGLAWDSGVLLAFNTPSKTSPRTSPIGSGEITDGLTQTFLVMEDSGRAAEHGGQWANGQQCFAHEYPTINDYRRQGIYSDHPQGANVLSVDGRVRFLTVETDPYIIGALATRAHGEISEQTPPPSG